MGGGGNEITEKLIGRKWRKLHFSKKVGSILKDKVKLSKHRRVCLKDSFKSSIWSLEVAGERKIYPVILKIIKSRGREESQVELNMYRKARHVFQGLMPHIYFIEHGINGKQWWVCMEHGRPVKGQLTFTPHHFLKIIPSLAELHARTYNDRYQAHKNVFAGWLPHYLSDSLKKERMNTNLATKQLLEQAMRTPSLHELIKPSYAIIKKLLDKGPLVFPEVVEAGQSVLHSDLQTANMCCDNIKKKQWDIRFIDWEGARYAPCWFDMINMVGIFLAYRKDWRSQENTIVEACVDLYVREMKKRGISFKIDPIKMYKMAYLQRIVEKSLYLQLNWEINSIKKAALLPIFINKVKVWADELRIV